MSQERMSGVRQVEPGLDLGEFRLAERGQMRVGKGAEREVHFPQAATAGAKQNATPSRVEPGAGEGHKVLAARLRALI